MKDLNQKIELRKIVEQLASETFYTYSFVRREFVVEDDVLLNRLRIAVKRGEKIYDVVSAVALALESDPLITKGIRISEIKEASEEQITMIANNLASSTDRTILSYKRLMQKKLEKEDEIRNQDIKNCGRLLKLAMKIGEKNQQ